MEVEQQRFLDWLKTQQVGCAFARHLAKRPDEARWQGVTVVGAALGPQQVATLNALLAEACATAEAISFLFPQINTADEVIGLIRSLCATDEWQCVEVEGVCPHSRGALLLGLRWFLPDNRHMNYVLGFAKLPEMPRTRHAPYTALVLRTGPPGRVPDIAYAFGAAAKKDERESEQPPVPVHLADMDDLLSAPDDAARLWSRTTELKRNQLRGDPMAAAAKAKITFCLPSAAREALAGVLTDKIVLAEPGAMM